MKLCVAIVGPTASGKSTFALELAKVVSGEILCMDSTTVYRGFDIGTAKPSAEHREQIPHHLLDISDPSEGFSAYHFVARADEVMSDIHSRGKIPIIIGGTNFYLKALQHGMYPGVVVPSEVIDTIESEYFDEDSLDTLKMHQWLKEQDPKAATKIHPNDRYRLVRALAVIRTTGQLPSNQKPEPISKDQNTRHWLKYSMAIPRHVLNSNIVQRANKMLELGLVEEAKQLMERYPNSRAIQSIGYAEAKKHLTGKITIKQLRNEMIEKTRQLAKRQLCWIRSDSEIRFINHADLGRVKLEIDNLLFALSSTPNLAK